MLDFINMNINESSIEFYNSMSDSCFKDYSQVRENYIRTIDRLIVEQLQGIKNKNILDAGSGDGSRSHSLASQLDVENLVMVDNSIEMIRKCKLIGESHCDSIETFKHNHLKFDAIISLWNVFGHVQNPVCALKNLSRQLKDDGLLFIDINNRHNMREYGFYNAMRNIIIDMTGSAGHGEFPLRGSSMKVYIYCADEFENIVNKAGLDITQRVFVNYNSGKKCTRFGGQIFYIIKNNC